ncbi:carbohydrate porin [Bradyrhizobium sp. AZCC 1693]|uniref:carbohydrate porin n=1 Tax=Bradyrhizobium sp. AZCC 1693 TaxID=3117029 RepID=UPI002FF2CBF7
MLSLACCISLLGPNAVAQPAGDSSNMGGGIREQAQPKQTVGAARKPKGKSDAGAARSTAPAPVGNGDAAAPAASPARFDRQYGFKGWNIMFPSYADTLLQDYGSFRSTLAEYGFGFAMIQGPVAAGNMLDALRSGPGPSNGPGKSPSSQQYFGQQPSLTYGNSFFLTYDTSRYGIPDGQLAVAGVASWSSWDHFAPNRFGLYNLSWYQTLLDRKLELKIGYMSNAQEWIGPNIGGSFASPFGASASIPYLMGMSPNAITQPTARVTWHITDSLYDQFGVMRSLGINGPSGDIVYDDSRFYNPTGFRFSVPNGGLLAVNELGWKTGPAFGPPQTWVRAGLMYNTSPFQNYETGAKDSGVGAAYFLADRQLWQNAPGSPLTAYRGVYAGISAMYAPPEYAAYSQYYEARVYSVGLFDLRNPRQGGHRFRRKAVTDSDRKRPANPNEGGHPVDRVRRGALSAI